MPPFLKVSKTGDRSRPEGLSEHAIVKVWRQLLSTLENYIIKGLVNKIKSFQKSWQYSEHKLALYILHPSPKYPILGDTCIYSFTRCTYVCVRYYIDLCTTPKYAVLGLHSLSYILSLLHCYFCSKNMAVLNLDGLGIFIYFKVQILYELELILWKYLISHNKKTERFRRFKRMNITSVYLYKLKFA